jgi:hypothetical protein
MNQASAVISEEARKVIEHLQAEDMVIPSAENCAQYRRDLLNTAQTDIQLTLKQFDGELKDIDIAGVACL